MARALDKRLRSARGLLRDWRRSTFDSHKCRDDGPDRGKVTDPAALHEIARFDGAIKAVGEAIKLVERAAASHEGGE